MNQIDPQEFGRLQAQVETLIASDAAKTALLAKLADDMTAVRLQLSEAGGGWKMLVALGGAASAIGGLITWAATHVRWGGA
jgi:hypothetical protein